nr:helix-turn-helix domain-containing protein [Mesorhizobium sp. LSHC416B00]
MDERLRFVVECLAGDETMVALCAAYGISRKNGYKWLGRYREFGPEGLHDLPRAPLNQGRYGISRRTATNGSDVIGSSARKVCTTCREHRSIKAGRQLRT